MGLVNQEFHAPSSFFNLILLKGQKIDTFNWTLKKRYYNFQTEAVVYELIAKQVKLTNKCAVSDHVARRPMISMEQSFNTVMNVMKDRAEEQEAQFQSVWLT